MTETTMGNETHRKYQPRTIKQHGVSDVCDCGHGCYNHLTKTILRNMFSAHFMDGRYELCSCNRFQCKGAQS